MAHVRINEDGIKRRQNRIALLRQKNEWVKSLGDLKAHPGWIGLSEIIKEVIKTQEVRIAGHLEATDGDANHDVEAKKCQARKVLAEYLLSLVKDPVAASGPIGEEISNLEQEISSAKEGELV